MNCTPKPTEGRIPIWIGASVDSAIRRAARLGDGWFAFGIDDRTRKVYLDARAEAGKPADQASIAALPMAWVIASDDPERDWSILRPYAFTELWIFMQWLNEAGMLGLGAVPQTEQDAERSGMFTVATRDEIVAKIRAVHTLPPFDRFVQPTNLRGGPMDIANRSLKLFGEKIIPAVRDVGEV